MALSLAKGRPAAGPLTQLGPFLLLGAVGVRMHAGWGAIPDRIPLHFRFDGQPDRWTEKSYQTVYGLWALGVGLCLLQWVLSRLAGKAAMSAGSAANELAPRVRARTQAVFIGVAYLIAVTFSLVLLAVVGPRPFPALAAGLATGTFLLWAVVLGVQVAREVRRMEAQTPGASDAWRYGVFYVNAEDARLFVPKRYGLGYTLNFARPAAWLVMLLLLALPVVLLWSLRPGH
jgi:uncharacterized membrane protein